MDIKSYSKSPVLHLSQAPRPDVHPLQMNTTSRFQEIVSQNNSHYFYHDLQSQTIYFYHEYESSPSQYACRGPTWVVTNQAMNSAQNNHFRPTSPPFFFVFACVGLGRWCDARLRCNSSQWPHHLGLAGEDPSRSGRKGSIWVWQEKIHLGVTEKDPSGSGIRGSIWVWQERIKYIAFIVFLRVDQLQVARV